MANPRTREPRWPAFVAMVAAGLLYAALPKRLSVGPGWLLLAVIFGLLGPIIFSYQRGHHGMSHRLMLVVNTVITLAMVASLGYLIQGMPKRLDSPVSLLRSAAALWVTNVLVFALWYWKLDAGGPLGRESALGRVDSAFLFPQMIEERDSSAVHWSPQFMDYLFLAFNTSTAFSPSDTAVRSRWAKAGMMLQSLISLTIVALLAARAISFL